MLTITPPALTVMRRVLTHQKMEPTSGLRVAAQSDPSEPLEVQFAQGPEPGDAIIERQGGRLVLDPVAAGRFEGWELDAVTDDEGRLKFVLRNAA